MQSEFRDIGCPYLDLGRSFFMANAMQPVPVPMSTGLLVYLVMRG